jgi:serine/threonine-protein kinase
LKKINQYIFGHTLNAGGTATVHFGINEFTGFPVAIKELNPKLLADASMREKFIGEANNYLYLEHKNIVKLEDLILLDGSASGYLIMEYIDGDNLKDYLRKMTGPMPIAMASAMIIETLDALAYAHEQNVVHLDIKPGNIMLCSRTNMIKLIDFGISANLSKQQDKTIMGTPYYMSPEQLVGQDMVDFRSDIYSVGITLYELIKGKTPFAHSQTREELKENIQNKDVPRITESFYAQEEKLLPTINRIIYKSTQKDPDDRYDDCRDFIEDLTLILKESEVA